MVFVSCKKIPTVPEPQLPIINYFNANPEEIDFGEQFTLSWSVSYAKTIYIDNGVGNVRVSGYNWMVTITCYSDSAQTTIIDTAHGFPANLGDIPPAVRTYFDAVAFDCTSHDQLPTYTVKMDWLNRDSMVNQLLLKKINELYFKTQEVKTHGKRWSTVELGSCF